MSLLLGVFLITLTIISSTTVVNSLETTTVIEKLVYKNENIDKKVLLFNTIVEILNNEELNIGHFISYNNNDIENLYQRGLMIYRTLSKNQIEQKKENIVNSILMNRDCYTSILNVINKNEKIKDDIEKLSNNNNCNECDNSNINIWYPGKTLICVTLFILILALIPITWIGQILLIITNGKIGGFIMDSGVLVGAIGAQIGCWELPIPP